VTDPEETYGQRLLKMMDGPWKELPGEWSGFNDLDLDRIRGGMPDDTASDEDWLKDKMYFAALHHVILEARYTDPNGDVLCIEDAGDYNLELVSIGPCDD
jgi:hypothetical protein